MTLPERSYTSGSGYRFGFQGQETDDEVNGKGNSVFFKYRVHDPRIGRFASVDPLSPKYPYLIPYHFSHNSPIYTREIEGLEGEPSTESDKAFVGGPSANQLFTAVEVADKTVRQQRKLVRLGFWGNLARGVNVLGYVLLPANSGAGPYTGVPLPDFAYEQYYSTGENILGLFPRNLNLFDSGRLYNGHFDIPPSQGQENNEEYVTLYRGVSIETDPTIVYSLAKVGMYSISKNIST